MGLEELSEVSEIKVQRDMPCISKKSNDKFEKLMGDDKIEEVSVLKKVMDFELNPKERESKFSRLFEFGDFFQKKETAAGQEKEKNEIIAAGQKTEDRSSESDNTEKREANTTYEVNGNIYETDDNGQTYKKNKEILPDTEYTVNGNRYRTDEHGNKISCDSNPRYTEEGTRNVKEQKESGGEERRHDDDGGHIIARILGGAEGEENLVPMRRTINRGDYKKMENEMAKALQEGKSVTVHIELEYEGDSERPSRIRAEYIIDGKKTEVEFDNNENSTELLGSLEGTISEEDYCNLKGELADMKEDGIDGSITSVKTEYDKTGNPEKITVGVLDESTGEKSYKVYEAG